MQHTVLNNFQSTIQRFCNPLFMVNASEQSAKQLVEDLALSTV